jgi:hypothetical protein
MGFAADLDVSCASSSVTHCIFHFKASFVLVELVSFTEITFELLRGSEMKLGENKDGKPALTAEAWQ